MGGRVHHFWPLLRLPRAALPVPARLPPQAVRAPQAAARVGACRQRICKQGWERPVRRPPCPRQDQAQGCLRPEHPCRTAAADMARGSQLERRGRCGGHGSLRGRHPRLRRLHPPRPPRSWLPPPDPPTRARHNSAGGRVSGRGAGAGHGGRGGRAHGGGQQQQQQQRRRQHQRVCCQARPRCPHRRLLCPPSPRQICGAGPHRHGTGLSTGAPGVP
mmetsp:Transcript_28081/g.66774  ORF Transcript_28081/g.66774 Transcript_28081/m.66774 type:complete len:217 (-) Transcript_28081:477-1127(-)